MTRVRPIQRRAFAGGFFVFVLRTNSFKSVACAELVRVRARAHQQSSTPGTFLFVLLPHLMLMHKKLKTAFETQMRSGQQGNQKSEE